VADDDDLWESYEKDRLPPGWSYPLGRDRIAEALRDAGAVLGSLRLWGPGRPPHAQPYSVCRVMWAGDSQADYFGLVPVGRSRLHMSWDAVPGEHRKAVADLLEGGTLRQVCEWATRALNRGNVWSATRHELVVTYADGRLHVSEPAE
jgi:hypothetical protein